jgi:zinc protease
MPLPPSDLRSPGKTAPKPEPSAARPAPKEPVYPPLHSIEPPKMTAVALPNGLKLYLVEDHELPMVQGLAVVRAGSVFDPVGKEGLAELTIELARKGGTRGHSGQDWDTALDRMSGRVDTILGPTVGGLSFWAPRENAGSVLQAVAAMLAEPALRLEKLEVAKAERRAELMRRNNESSEAALREFVLAAFGPASPYGREQTEASVAGIEQVDVAGFYRHYFFPANTSLAIQGDFDSAAMQATLAKLFGEWHAPGGGPVEVPKSAGAAAPAAYVLPARSLLRAYLSVGQTGPALGNADSAAWEVLAEILGGTRRARLLQQVHSPVPADTLEIGAQWLARIDHPGVLSIAAVCGEAGFTAVLGGVETEVRRLQTAPVTEDELRIAKDAALAKLALAQDTKGKRLSESLLAVTTGYPPDFLARYQASVAAVTRADVDRVAKTLDPARFTIVAIGDAEDLARQLKAMGRTASRLNPPVKEAPPAAAPTAEAVARGRQFMTRAQLASGAADPESALRDASRTAHFDMGVLAGGGRQVLTQSWIAPNVMRQQSTGTSLADFTNGQAGWVSDGVRSGALAGADLEQVQGTLFRWYPRILLGDRVPGRTLFAVADDAVEIREGERRETLVLDDGGLPRELLYWTTSTQGLPIAVEELYEDFRPVGGVKLPFRVRILHNGEAAGLVTVQEQTLNSGLKVEELAKRQ